jgi:hypothetical protein
MLDKPKILTILLKEQVGGVGIIVQHGNTELTKQIPADKGIVRMAVIFDNDGKASDLEITLND